MDNNHDIGKRKAPKVLMPDDALDGHFDQSHFDETQQKREQGLLALVRKVATQNPETRVHLHPLIRLAAEMDAEEHDAVRVVAHFYGDRLTPQRWEGATCFEKLALLQKVANKPIMQAWGLNKSRVRAGEAFMVYNIDPEGNHSKFYEGLLVDEDGGHRLKRRWGALTDSGKTGRVDGAKWDTNEKLWFEDLNTAKREIAQHYAKRMSRGYTDAFGPKHKTPDGKKLPMGQYPVGLSRATGFGWGTQSVATCSPSLRALQEEIAKARLEITRDGKSLTIENALDRGVKLIKELASEDSTMGMQLVKLMSRPIRRMRGAPRFLPDPEGVQLMKELNTLFRYIEKQLSLCH